MNGIARLAITLLLVLPPAVARGGTAAAGPATPLVVGETFTLDSKVLGEVRRINVYRPPFYGDSATTPRPVLYMPDGGIGEDFLHVAGLLEVSVGNATMRPFLLVGIENTQRRRDLTGPTRSSSDRRIAPHVGGSAAFRSFLRDELMPAIRSRYPTTGETAIMGESLAGLFVMETLFTEPDLFDTYVAFDPSLWWDDSSLVSAPMPRWPAGRPRTLYLANSGEPSLEPLVRRMVDRLRDVAPAALRFTYQQMPAETHATIYHPAALDAVRRVFPPPAAPR